MMSFGSGSVVSLSDGGIDDADSVVDSDDDDGDMNDLDSLRGILYSGERLPGRWSVESVL